MLKWTVLASLLAGPALAGGVEIREIHGTDQGGSWRFDVTVKHDDTGWDHYADGWYILAPDGSELGYRKLLHPHVNEQPFTRSLSGVAIPDDVATVTVESHDSVHGWGGAAVEVALPR